MERIPSCVAVALSALAFAAPALAEATALDASPASFSMTGAASRLAAEESKPAVKAFGAPGWQAITVGAGVAFGRTDSQSATDINGSVAWNYFLVQDFEFSLEGAGWYFNQPGEDQGGGSASLAFRWHFVNKKSWSIFAEVGIGVLGAGGDVPTGGTEFNFLPRAGVGFTYQLTDSGIRLQGGVRWHHISNARINGDSNNPSRDGVMIFTGIMFPF